MFSKGDTIITGILGTIEPERHKTMVVPVGTKGIIHTFSKADADDVNDVDSYRVLFGFKNKRCEGWMSEWKPTTTRMVLIEKTIIALTMEEHDMIEWTHKF